MQVLLDTDVVLDVLLDRVSFAQDSRAIWNACAHNQLVGYINSITPINVFTYCVRLLAYHERALGLAILSLCSKCVLLIVQFYKQPMHSQ